MPVLDPPYQLEHTALEKVWGATQLEPWFPNPARKTGELWFTEPGCPLLIKFLFTTENLSVQVHPDDQQAAKLEAGSCGKTEMWHILKADPDAKLAMGLKSPVPQDQLRAACEDGSVMDLLRWVPAIPGETWFIPAGTIHAIGAGITLAEIQQNSDVTYRLFDYGRTRELHLEKGLAVTNVDSRPEPAGNQVVSQYFCTQVIEMSGLRPIGPGYLIIVGGGGDLDGHFIRPGQVWHIPQSAVLNSVGSLRVVLTTA